MNLTRLACIIGLSLTSICLAETPSVLAPTPPAPEKPTSILQGRPDANVSTDEALGEEFRGLAAGVAFRPPVGGTEIKPAIGSDDIVQFQSEKPRWSLKVS